MGLTGVLGGTAEKWNRGRLFRRKGGTRRTETASPNLPGDEINSQQKAETANQDSHS